MCEVRNIAPFRRFRLIQIYFEPTTWGEGLQASSSFIVRPFGGHPAATQGQTAATPFAQPLRVMTQGGRSADNQPGKHRATKPSPANGAVTVSPNPKPDLQVRETILDQRERRVSSDSSDLTDQHHQLSHCEWQPAYEEAVWSKCRQIPPIIRPVGGTEFLNRNTYGTA